MRPGRASWDAISSPSFMAISGYPDRPGSRSARISHEFFRLPSSWRRSRSWWAAVGGIGLALLSARYPHALIDGTARVISLAGNSIPIFWLGLIALFVFYARLHWVGGTGRLSDAFEYTVDMKGGFVLFNAWRSPVPGALGDAAAHLILPVLILASYALGNITRLTRAALIGEAEKEYVMLARAKGAGRTRVLLRHIAPNVRGITLTVIALTYANLLEGAVLIETVFARPGIGRYLTTALFGADMPAILGATLADRCVLRHHQWAYGLGRETLGSEGPMRTPRSASTFFGGGVLILAAVIAMGSTLARAS
jgi:hypothetical protein